MPRSWARQVTLGIRAVILLHEAFLQIGRENLVGSACLETPDTRRFVSIDGRDQFAARWVLIIPLSGENGVLVAGPVLDEQFETVIRVGRSLNG